MACEISNNAAASFEAAIRVDPGSAGAARAHKHLGVTRHDHGDLAGAQSSFEAAVHLSPRDSEAQNSLGAMHYMSGEQYTGGWAAGQYAGMGTMTRHGAHVATGDWTSWTWVGGSWDAPYPREGGRGTLVTARRSSGSPAPRRPLGKTK